MEDIKSLTFLHSQFETLLRSASRDDWRQLSQDLLTALIARQAHVIALQREMIDALRAANEHGTNELRRRADEAFTEVQQLTMLRRAVLRALATRAEPLTRAWTPPVADAAPERESTPRLRLITAAEN